MPYVTFADYPPEPNGDLEAEASATKPDQDLVVKNDWKVQHESHTLDQFYYHSLENIEKRDESQVVSHYIRDSYKETPRVPKGKIPILRVDQIWLWVIDDSKFSDISS